jgi:outer membrane lipoprotein-sorting protein
MKFIGTVRGGRRAALFISGLCLSLASLPQLHAQTPPAPAKPAKPAATAVKPFVPMDPAAALQKANAYFNSATTMIGDFVQIGGDGRRTEGKLYIQRPGRMRFEYAPPATLEVVSDGLSVAVHDRKTATRDVYFISQTPVKFLLKEQVDLNRDVKVIDVHTIKLVFDPDKVALKQWQVTDPQGYETLVSLFNIDLVKKPDPALFQLTQERVPNTNN